MSENIENENETENLGAQETEHNADEQTTLESAEGDQSEQQTQEQEDYKKKFFYVAAEMDNMKKRFDREKENLIKYGNEKVLSGLIDVVDNFERTLDAISTEEDDKIVNIANGIKMVRDQFIDVLKKNGLETVKSVGEIFDPNFHEALAQQPAEGKEDQEILTEYQKGYILNGRLLRAAKVVVAKN